jgi:aminopeptidase
VHPGLPREEAVAKLEEQLVYVLRLDEDDAAAAWRERVRQLHEAGTKLDGASLDALHFEGPGTDLTIGLLPTSRFAQDAPGAKTIDGIVHVPNLPTEEVYTTPDPARTEGVVTATKPLDVGGTVVEGLRVRFESGRVVQIEADSGAEALRARCAKDDGASRLGEVALVDREGRIGRTGTVFFNTLLDENAASHIAFGSGFPFLVDGDVKERVNESRQHVDFMIGSPEVEVDGVTADGERVPVLRDGDWQI